MANWVMVHDCPHCGAENTGFTGVSGYEMGNYRFSLLARCNVCDGPLTAAIDTLGRISEMRSLSGDVLRTGHVLGVYPEVKPIEAPASVPDKVARAFIEAATNRRAELWNPACAAYRRTMELGLKTMSPDIEVWKLEKRIDRLATEHRITPELQTWAHELRLDGNEALHGDEDATEEMANQMHHLCWFLLTYLYTLPSQVAAVRMRREG
jgi:Domain of unknown function (DUF4145)